MFTIVSLVIPKKDGMRHVVAIGGGFGVSLIASLSQKKRFRPLKT